MSQTELDTVLGTVENPIRRRIIERLSQKPNYQLQLSKDLDISQQLVAKHLGSMEDAGLLSAVLEDSPRGPQRKEYLIRKSFSITIDLAPSLFRTRMFSFGAVPGTDPEDQGKMTARVSELMQFSDERSRLRPLAQIISEVDRKLDEMEERRAVLLYLRGLAFREAARVTPYLGTSDRKEVLKHLLKEQWEDIDDMSVSLGLRQQVAGSILEEIERDLASE